jgi:hypothetical protein
MQYVALHASLSQSMALIVLTFKKAFNLVLELALLTFELVRLGEAVRISRSALGALNS